MHLRAPLKRHTHKAQCCAVVTCSTRCCASCRAYSARIRTIRIRIITKRPFYPHCCLHPHRASTRVRRAASGQTLASALQMKCSCTHHARYHVASVWRPLPLYRLHHQHHLRLLGRRRHLLWHHRFALKMDQTGAAVLLIGRPTASAMMAARALHTTIAISGTTAATADPEQ